MGGYFARGLPMALTLAGILGYLLALSVSIALQIARPYISVPDTTLLAASIVAIVIGLIVAAASSFVYARLNPRAGTQGGALTLVGLALLLAAPWAASINAGLAVVGIALLAAAFR